MSYLRYGQTLYGIRIRYYNKIPFNLGGYEWYLLPSISEYSLPESYLVQAAGDENTTTFSYILPFKLAKYYFVDGTLQAILKPILYSAADGKTATLTYSSVEVYFRDSGGESSTGYFDENTNAFSVTGTLQTTIPRIHFIDINSLNLSGGYLVLKTTFKWEGDTDGTTGYIKIPEYTSDTTKLPQFKIPFLF